MTRIWLAIAGLGGLCSVAAGAAAAHHSDAHAAELLRTGALYGMVHAVALLGVSGLARDARGVALGVVGAAFAAGIVLFSFSLFALALTGVPAFGWATPFGGTAFMIGWAALAIFALRGR